jgi:hypothetical protein
LIPFLWLPAVRRSQVKQRLRLVGLLPTPLIWSLFFSLGHTTQQSPWAFLLTNEKKICPCTSISSLPRNRKNETFRIPSVKASVELHDPSVFMPAYRQSEIFMQEAGNKSLGKKVILLFYKKSDVDFPD